MTEPSLPPAERRTIEPSREQLARIAELPADQPVTMLNLLRFREVADYSDAPGLAPDEPISGAEAYARYGAAATPHIQTTQAEVVYQGACGPTLIGPDGEGWDAIILVRYPTPQAFIEMVTAQEYVALSGHRTAALADSRLVATTSS